MGKKALLWIMLVTFLFILPFLWVFLQQDEVQVPPISLQLAVFDSFMEDMDTPILLAATALGLENLSLDPLGSRKFLSILQRQCISGGAYAGAVVSHEQAAVAENLGCSTLGTETEHHASEIIYQSSIVFLVNRHLDRPIPRTWKELGDSGLAVMIHDTDLPVSKASVLACAMALGGDEADLSPAYAFFRTLKSKGLLFVASKESKREEWSAHPVGIMWDYQALSFINDPQGGAYEIVVPGDGTLVSGRSFLVFPETQGTAELLQLRGYLLSPQGQTLLAERGFYPIRPELVDERVLETLLPGETYLRAPTILDLDAWIETSAFFRRDWRRLVNLAPGSVTTYEKSLFASFVLLLMVAANTALFLRVRRSPALKGFMLLQAALFWWLGIRFLKYFLITDTLVATFWYMEYLGIIMLGPAWWMTGYAYYKERLPSPRTLAAVLIPALCLFLLVMTNNLHEKVFIFDRSFVFWYNNYKYGYVFYLILAYIAFMLGLGLIYYVMSVWKKAPLRRQAFYLVVGIALPFSLNTIYILEKNLFIRFNLPHPGQWLDMPQIISLVSLVFLTGALRNRFLDPETGLEPILRDSGVVAAVVGKDGFISWASRSFYDIIGVHRFITPQGLLFLEQNQGTVEEWNENIIAGLFSFNVAPQGGDAVYRTKIFTVGRSFALVMADVSEYRSLLSRLMERRAMLERSRKILETEYAITGSTASARERETFMAGLDETISETLQELRQESGALPDKAEEDRLSSLWIIKLKAFHCHQLLRLYLYSLHKQSMDHEAAVSFLKALVNHVQAAGLIAEFFAQGQGQVRIDVLKNLHQALYHLFIPLFERGSIPFTPGEGGGQWVIRYFSSQEERSLTVFLPADAGLTVSEILPGMADEFKLTGGDLEYHVSCERGMQTITTLRLVWPDLTSGK
jgi:ABC-type Fe3+ transport system substrate-binding protein